jgi:hypothetical protein
VALTDNPTVGQANASLRAQAVNAAWWLNHWANADKLEDPMVRRGMANTARLLSDAVNASNKALDAEAFNVRP